MTPLSKGMPRSSRSCLLQVSNDSARFPRLYRHALDSQAFSGPTMHVCDGCVGADPNAPNKYGQTALFSAANKGHFKCVKKLLTAGAHVELQDEDGLTVRTRAQPRLFARAPRWTPQLRNAQHAQRPLTTRFRAVLTICRAQSSNQALDKATDKKHGDIATLLRLWKQEEL